MHAPIKYFEKGLSIAANGAWVVFNGLNKINQRPSFIPKWSDKPLLKSYEKTKPPLGWPRETDSLCPVCTREARQEILDGKKDVSVLLNEKVGEIKAHHRARRQDPHGEGLPPPRPLRGRDGDGHGLLQAPRGSLPGPRHPRPQRREAPQPRQRPRQHGRGSVLTVDLTNRCNMMCDPCFMDANQVGFVHELTLGRHQDHARQRHHHQAAPPDVGAVLRRRADDLSPYFLDAVRYARKVGYNSSPGRHQRHRVRQVRSSRRPPPKPVSATRICSSTASATPPTRTAASATLFDVKLRAIQNLHRRGVDIVPVITIVNGINNEQVGADHRVRARQPQADQLPLLPAGVVHRPRRGVSRRAPRRPALHAVAPGARRQEPDGPRRADPRLVPDFLHVHVHRLGRRRRTARTRELGTAHLRLPPELRHRHGADDRQGNQGSRAGHGLPEGRTARQGRRAGQRRGRGRFLVGTFRHGARWLCCATTTRSRPRRTSS